MKTVILAGGFGTRIRDVSEVLPKPMIYIGGRPILWHLLKIYSHFGLRDFIICCGHKGDVIKRYFYDQYTSNRDFTVDYKTGTIKYHREIEDDWSITFVDTGFNTMTGGRLARIREYVDDEPFCMTYGDGLADINIKTLIAFHYKHNRLVTVTAVKPPNRFGVLSLGPENMCTSFSEKPLDAADWINGGFFVINPKALDLISNDSVSWEQEPLAKLAIQSQLTAYMHDGFWQPMDTQRDKILLDKLWANGCPPWKVWS